MIDYKYTAVWQHDVTARWRQLCCHLVVESKDFIVSLLCGYLFLYPDWYSRIISLLQKREFQYLKLKVLLLETFVSSAGNFGFTYLKLWFQRRETKVLQPWNYFGSVSFKVRNSYLISGNTIKNIIEDYWILFSKSTFPSFTSFRISSPNSVFCHANQERVKFFGSFLWKDSCMNPVPASVSISILMQVLISASFWLVNAFIIILMGQIMSYPMCGPPIPSPAVPLKK